MAQPSISATAISDLELDLLIKAIHHRYGFDFSHYKRASLKRRILLNIERQHLSSISQLIPKVLWDSQAFEQLLEEISVPVTEFFRDPPFYRAVREKILPVLKTYPKVRIWIVGCATGEEVYSIAILLKEANIVNNVIIYASDFNKTALAFAQKGIYENKHMHLGALNYKNSGGPNDFYNYFEETSEGWHVLESLSEMIHFFGHDLTQAEPMPHLHMICCRNMFIYFDRRLQIKSSYLFYESLLTGGYLALGPKESLDPQLTSRMFQIVDEPSRIYRKWPT